MAPRLLATRSVSELEEEEPLEPPPDESVRPTSKNTNMLAFIVVLLVALAITTWVLIEAI